MIGAIPSNESFAESTARFRSEQKITSNFLLPILSLSAFDCSTPFSESGASDQPDEISCSLSVVVPWTKYVIKIAMPGLKIALFQIPCIQYFHHPHPTANCTYPLQAWECEAGLLLFGGIT